MAIKRTLRAIKSLKLRILSLFKLQTSQRIMRTPTILGTPTMAITTLQRKGAERIIPSKKVSQKLQKIRTLINKMTTFLISQIRKSAWVTRTTLIYFIKLRKREASKASRWLTPKLICPSLK